MGRYEPSTQFHTWQRIIINLRTQSNIESTKWLISQLLPKNLPIPLKWKRGNPITSVSAVKVRNSPSVMLFIKTHPLALSCTRQRKQKKCIFVVANLLPVNPFVMERTQKFRNI